MSFRQAEVALSCRAEATPLAEARNAQPPKKKAAKRVLKRAPEQGSGGVR